MAYIGFVIGGVIIIVFFGLYCSIPFALAVKHFKREKAANPTLEYVRPNIGMHILHFLTHIFGILIGIFLAADCIVEGIGACAGLFCFCWIIYGVIAAFSAQYKAMANMRSVTGSATFMQQLRQTGPVLYLHVRCWHIEHYTTSYTDSDGHRHTEHHTREVTTYSSSHFVPIPFWRDDTPPLFLPPGRLLIHVKIRKLILWQHNSEAVIAQMLRRLYLLNCWRDVHCDVWQEQRIPGLTPENMVLNGDSSQLPACVKTYTRVLYAVFWSAITYSYEVSALASVVRQVVIKHASLILPVVDPKWCEMFRIDINSVRPTAPVIDPNQLNNWNPGESSIAGLAPPAPCIENPLPLVTLEPPNAQFENSWGSASDKMDPTIVNFAPPADIQNDVSSIQKEHGCNFGNSS